MNSALERNFLSRVSPAADGNIRPLYSIEQSPWIWHPDFVHVNEPVVLLFKNEFTLKTDAECTFHISADERFELYLDGQLSAMGPDRSDVAHWSFHTYILKLPAGHRTIEVLVWRIGNHAPIAQISQGGGFIAFAEGKEFSGLCTGSDQWKVKQLQGWSFKKALEPYLVGDSHIVDAKALLKNTASFVTPVPVRAPIKLDRCGIMRQGPRLVPTTLPEQSLKPVSHLRIRALLQGKMNPKRVIRSEEAKNITEGWTAFANQLQPVVIPPETEVSVLLDWEDYVCGYPVLRLLGGDESEVSVAWSESLFDPDSKGYFPDKWNRNDITGKYFSGIPDIYHPFGPDEQTFRPYWWRAGRYILLSIRTANTPLTLLSLRALECRYPVEYEGSFASSNPDIDRTIPMLVRGIQSCSHETFMDCPYYEQLQYVGDTRLQILTTYVMTPDNRLIRRAIELFDASRYRWELVAEQYPSRSPQLSATFSMLWISMVKDYALWRGDRAFIRERMPGVRAVLEQFRLLIGKSGLLEKMPGWPFMDWVPGWDHGNARTSVDGLSSINNLLLVQALRHAAWVEEALGENLLAQRNLALAETLAQKIMGLFWDESRHLIADDSEHRFYSEHAQCLALINNVIDRDKQEACFQALCSAPDLSRTSIYFSFYLFEAFRQFNRGDLICQKMAFWTNLVDQGLKTPVECPEPARSDCHAWGSHPLFHMAASLCGIRPLSFGFETLEITPSPGSLTRLECKVPHPKGWIELALNFFPSGGCQGRIVLPEQCRATFRWKGTETVLNGGRNELTKV